MKSIKHEIKHLRLIQKVILIGMIIYFILVAYGIYKGILAENRSALGVLFFVGFYLFHAGLVALMVKRSAVLTRKGSYYSHLFWHGIFGTYRVYRPLAMHIEKLRKNARGEKVIDLRA
jgi:hypothetical protein